MSGIIVVHGAPGAGKSTQSRDLSGHLVEGCPIFHISAGERLRAIRSGELQSEYGAEVNSSSAPNPLPHKLVNNIVFEPIISYPFNSIVLIDGYPRFIGAVEPFLKAIKENGHSFLGCLHLQISEEISASRLFNRGLRRGERISVVNSEVVEKRYREHLIYVSETIRRLKEIAPVIDINASLSREEVQQSFNEAFRELVKDYFK